MSRHRYSAARVTTGTESFEPGFVEIDEDNGTLSGIGPLTESPAVADAIETRHLGEVTIAPGFIDLHLHGGVGSQVNGEVEEEIVASLSRIASFHASHGTTSFLATTASDSPARLLASARAVARAAREPAPGGARVAGLHLEGPFLSPARKGAQSAPQLRPPDLEELSCLMEAAQGTLRLVTLAPELDGAMEMISELRACGVTAALGHSDASFETAVRAFAAGASHVTHLFNAMAPLTAREPGLIGATLSNPEVTFELIADLQHVHEGLLELAFRMGPDRAVAVSDASPLAGTSEGAQSDLGSEGLVRRGKRVTLAADTSVLAGSALTLDVALANLVQRAGVAFDDALLSLSVTPGRIAGVPGLAEGAPADLVVLDDDLSLRACLVGGRPVKDLDALFA